MRSWLLTSTTYGTWLPGDPRGSVTSVRDHRPTDIDHLARFEHDAPGEPWEDPIPGLYRSSVEEMTGPPIYFELPHAEILLAQFRETATFRHWHLLAVAIMYNHFHLVVQMESDPDPTKMLGDFKAYGSRALNARYGKPPSGTWWTENGSKRKLTEVEKAVEYVLYKQYRPLVVWPAALGRFGEPGA